MRNSIILGAALAAAAVLTTPDQSQAQGFGFRIGNVGVGVGSYYGGGFGYGGYGGYGYGYPYYGYRSYYGSPYGWNTTGYSWAPGYSNWYTPSYSYYSGAPVTTQSFYQGAQADVSPNAAYVRVAVPSNARLWFQDQETSQRGNERVFYSPPLTPGQDFIYTLKAAWTGADGKEVTRTREVRVKAGSTINVDMTAAGNEIRSGYQPADQAKPAPADNNPNAYRGPREVTPLTPGTPPAVTAPATTTQQVVPVQPATGNNTTVIVPGGVGIAPNLGPTTPVPQGTIARPGTNEPNVVPPVNTSTPGAPPTPAGTAPIGPATPANPNVPALNPTAPSNLPGPAPRQ